MPPADVLITGGAGFLGVSVAKRLLARSPAPRVVLTDIARHPRLAQVEERAEFIAADLGDPSVAHRLIGERTTHVFHFASLVSGGAEQDFPGGMRANLHATLQLLDACRVNARRPRFVFPSSIATFGGARLPPEVDDLTHQHPQNSYGVAKVMCEQFINDCSRRGYVDGRAVRLAAIVVRDEPNSAASGFASALIREPIAGRPYRCPVSPDARMPILGLNRCIDLLVALGDCDAGPLGDFRAFNGPSISPTAAEILAAVKRVAGKRQLAPVEWAPDPRIQAIIATWPRSMRAERAAALGLAADASIDAIVRDYLASLDTAATAGAQDPACR